MSKVCLLKCCSKALEFACKSHCNGSWVLTPPYFCGKCIKGMAVLYLGLRPLEITLLWACQHIINLHLPRLSSVTWFFCQWSKPGFLIFHNTYRYVNVFLFCLDIFVMTRHRHKGWSSPCRCELRGNIHAVICWVPVGWKSVSSLGQWLVVREPE